MALVAATRDSARVAVRRSDEIRMVFSVFLGGAEMAASRGKTYARPAQTIIRDVPHAVFGFPEQSLSN
jgi:hypothetical protein